MIETVDVILPTRAFPGRAELLHRAITSVLQQVDARAVPLVVINGRSADPGLVRDLEADRRLRVIRQTEAGLPEALRAGRLAVRSSWFATLDDDDELVPDALVTRLRAAGESPGPDVVVTNGIQRGPAGDFVHVRDASAVARDPLAALLDLTWLLPGSWLCRTGAEPSGLFDHMPRYLECTYLALRFASAARMRFLAEPTVIWHTQTPLSLSGSREFRIGQAAALERLLEWPMPAPLRASFARRLRQACHANAELFLDENARAEAWRWHLRSLRQTQGWRHLLYTRKLLLRSIRPHGRARD
ncbi:MAG: glycosyltransferase family 2 protein [Gemmatimonadetes bacterium]|nr:glycosyltransferase family 2 protein [Gemmatimonadota bacterium]